VRIGLPVATLALLLAGAPAGAQSNLAYPVYPARTGELGIMDVPDAEVAGRGRSHLGADLRFDKQEGRPNEFGPLPAYLVMGLMPILDLGLTMREWGEPGDPKENRMFFGAATKLQIIPPATHRIAGLALDATVDRINGAPVWGSRVIASTARLPIRLAGFLGFEAKTGSEHKNGLTAGLATTIPVGATGHFELEALTGPQGPNYGSAYRLDVSRSLSISLGGNYFQRDDALRVSIGFAFTPQRPKRPEIVPMAPTEAPTEVAAGPRFKTDRPQFKLKMTGATDGAVARHLQYGPFVAATRAADRPAPAADQPKAAAPTLEALAEAQLREQEALADAREKRVRSTADQLDAREKAALAEAKRLEDREKELAAREKELDARELKYSVKGPASQQQRQLESLEAQLAAQERTLAAQERSFTPAIEAATGREQDAGARENAERSEASRLAASVSGAPRPQQVEIRKQALGARNRQLAAFEARLVARGERIDALERQLRTKSERLDTWSRRLDTRAERLDLLERRASDAAPKQAAAPKPAEAKPAAPKDKAVFVMVVKSPTAIVKERGAASAAPSASPLSAGVAVEKAVAAATVVAFPTPASTLSELDRETIDNIARLAARENCEVLIWARAKDPSLMAEAQRRATDIKSRVIATGPLPDKQVVTRITTRPGAQGVDVVVSALRETARPAAAPVTGAPPLETGESGKRQIREAVQAAQPLIEGCIGEHIQAKKLQRAEGVLKLTISAQGKVQAARAIGADLGSETLDACLASSSAKWQFPTAEAEYVVDVPITVVQGGATK
jgi:hypothetical protein